MGLLGHRAVGAVGPPRRWGCRVTSAAALSLAALSVSESCGGSTWRFVLLLVFSFLFRSKIGLRCPAVHHHIIVDTPKDEVVIAPSQAAVLTLMIKPPPLVSRLLQVVAPPMLPVLVTMTRSESALLLQARNHRR